MDSHVDYVPALKRLGLTEYEAKVYVNLARGDPKTAGELSFISGVPRTKLYGSLRGLERKGLVKILHDKPERFGASSPSEFLFPLAENSVKDAQDSLEKVQSLVLAYESSKLILGKGISVKTELSVLQGRSAINEGIKRLLLGSSESAAIVASGNGMIRLYRSQAESIERLVSKGVRVRLITHVTPQNLSVAKEMANILQFRSSPKLNFQAFVADSSDIMFVEAVPDDLDDEVGSDVGVISQNPQIISGFSHLYDLIWASLPSAVVALKGTH